MAKKIIQWDIGLQELRDSLREDGELVVLIVKRPNGEIYKFNAYVEPCPNPYIQFKPVMCGSREVLGEQK